MALSSYVLHFFYKFKVLLLVTLCLMVLWATLSYIVDSRQAIPKAKSVVENFRKVTSLEEEEDSQKEKTKSTVKVPTMQSSQGHCPAVSPYLRGASKLTFKASLTLEEVEKENPQVAKGRYHPRECSALQHVAILIPHRNRERHLLYLLEHLHPFLQRQQLDYGIYVIHQAGSTKFNRAKLLNVGYLEALKEENWDCFIFHDVDLVPENDFNIYMCDRQPKHLVVGRNNTGYRLRYQGYFGGVTALTREQFSKVNGFSNNYWGWGGEDDDLRIRVEMQKMRVMRPSPDVARYTMIFHTRDQGNEENGERMKLLRQVSRMWKTDGLNSCSYKLLSVEHNPLYINITVDFSMQPKIS
ncbi:beta-1,4-galactosyltransferase 4 [Dromaius novaehollandiae]|uniref:Beta-1,4-galactosyltransferase n=2 Tax=Dromaius novaehollandiae TaxID=8790 RepID=A0A8C4J5Z8_DRONO|nr:beta-1,4-galactosyltransferase 4 [Dromaius novaehollandiae]XP_025966339.1 beta-1,4-galactosyltransferase 4 [Dromaius novaehollandiae]XP_025966340.1 beta-1,4-galactosyltransferase 4 [Dromaius novaehollandiae]XP_025966341.1 beta-1,4-galactosyltransferase 4 [Dromaius novaehollandiae]XP_025966342.1 beta-1,4-galactosyltransferase 4 [Dromaius novaehollandiae]XP_025966343.1 beta-1,4-galactosyltransferase 4 [Dromaius novaehollandiae]